MQFVCVILVTVDTKPQRPLLGLRRPGVSLPRRERTVDESVLVLYRLDDDERVVDVCKGRLDKVVSVEDGEVGDARVLGPDVALRGRPTEEAVLDLLGVEVRLEGGRVVISASMSRLLVDLLGLAGLTVRSNRPSCRRRPGERRGRISSRRARWRRTTWRHCPSARSTKSVSQI